MKLGEMRVNVDVATGECKNLFGNSTKKAFSAEGKRIFKNHPEYEYLRKDPWLTDDMGFYKSVLYAYMKDCVLKEHPEFQEKYNEIAKMQTFQTKGCANYNDKFKGKENYTYWMTNSDFMRWCNDYLREQADPGCLAREQAQKDKELQESIALHRQIDAYNAAKHPHVECPYCHSMNTEKISGVARGVSIYVMGVVSPKIGMQWHCNNCKSNF